MSGNKFVRITVSILAIFTLAACSLVGVPSTAGVPVQQQSGSLDTQVAAALASTLAAQTAVANALAATQAIVASATPEFTFTPSLTPSATFTFTPSVITVSVSVATNCRTGPTTAYDLLGVLKVGETAQVVGRSSLSDTMIIKLPSNPSITCWLWAQNATVAGDLSTLPLIAIPPSPTPVPTAASGFTVNYVSIIHCLGTYRLKFKITNTAGLTWESNSVKATDQVTSEVHTVSYDDFPNLSNACALVSDDLNLTSGEIGTTASGPFAVNPSGHSFKATINVCSLNGLAGTCLAQTLTFTP